MALGAIFAAALLEALAMVGTVIPGSSIVFVGGVLIGLNALNPWWTITVAIAGAVLGDGISYWLGHKYHEKIRALWPLKNHPELFDRGQAYFAKSGGKSVFLGRFLGPVRAIVPVVAGMSNMPAAAFYAINILSAVAWATAHIIPGVLFGASLQLAGAVSSRLVIMLVMTVALFWVISKVVRFTLSHEWSSIKWLRDRAVERARAKSGPVARIVLSLLDPARAKSQALLIAAVLLIGGAWLFLGILQDVLAKDPLVQFDSTVYSSLQSLRNGWADAVMITVTELGGAAGAVPVVVAVSLVLCVKRYWRTLGYWLAAAGVAEILVVVLSHTLARLRPNDIYTGIAQYSFPSGHTVLSVVIYGFMAFLLARGKPVRNKIAITLMAAVAIMLIAFSRLYLGAHWFSDVLASLSLGLAWIALLSIAYIHHVRNEQLPALPMFLIVLATLAVVEGTYVRGHQAEDTVRYSYRQKTEKTMSLSDWKAGGWRKLPFARSELGGEIEEPFSVQWVGTAGQVAGTLKATGWQSPEPWTLKTTLLWLLPTTAAKQLPVLPKFDHGEAQKLTFVRVINSRERIVIRLWPVLEMIENIAGSQSRPLWNGMVTIEHISRPYGLITLAEAETDFAASLNILEQDIQKQRLAVDHRDRVGVPVLLVVKAATINNVLFRWDPLTTKT